MRVKLTKSISSLPLSSVLWTTLAFVAVMALAAAEKYYDLPNTWVTILRALIVVLVGLRIIRNIETTLARKRATALSKVIAGEETSLSALSWQDSVTGIYITRLLLYAILALVTIFAVGGTLSGFVVGGTLVSVMLGVAGQSFFANFFGGLAIAIFKPFEIGDHIQLVAGQLPIVIESYPHPTRAQGYQGIIRDINLFYTELRLDSGQLLRVPNGIVINAGVLKADPNDWVRVHFRFDVDAGLDAQQVLRGLSEAAAEHFSPAEATDVPPALLGTRNHSARQPAGPDNARAAANAHDRLVAAMENQNLKQLGWQPPEVAIVDVSPSAISIEVRASVPHRKRLLCKEDFFLAALPHLRKPA
ncbi:MAG: mechanosensitive ion channel family protein [Pseudomonadota bacterium]